MMVVRLELLERGTRYRLSVLPQTVVLWLPYQPCRCLIVKSANA